MATLSHKPRNLALFLDGTWNTVSDNTNVWRLRSLLAPVSDAGLEQRAYYSAGLGTKFGERFTGGMFGSGINTAITNAYEWLVDNYETDDRVYLFGFSRGAYTARSLSGFISKAGLLRKGAPLGVNQLYMRYRRRGEHTVRELIDRQKASDSGFTFEERWLLKHSQAIPVEFIGVFDTVGALGVPFPLIREFAGTAYRFLNTGIRKSNKHAFHAVAVDEHRKDFQPTLWTTDGTRGAEPRPIDQVEQRWFVGAHANVGGGCFDDPLAQVPLEWIERKATKYGLTFLGNTEIEDSAATAGVSDSFAQMLDGWYRVMRLGRRFHREIGAGPTPEGAVTINETIDASVFQRWKTDPAYRPPGLAKWAAAKGIDLGKIAGAVRADRPEIVAPD